MLIEAIFTAARGVRPLASSSMASAAHHHFFQKLILASEDQGCTHYTDRSPPSSTASLQTASTKFKNSIAFSMFT